MISFILSISITEFEKEGSPELQDMISHHHLIIVGIPDSIATKVQHVGSSNDTFSRRPLHMLFGNQIVIDPEVSRKHCSTACQ